MVSPRLVAAGGRTRRSAAACSAAPRLFSVRPAFEYSLVVKIKGLDRYCVSLAIRPDAEQRRAKVFSRFAVPQEFERIAVVVPKEKRRLLRPHAQRQRAIPGNDVGCS